MVLDSNSSEFKVNLYGEMVAATDLKSVLFGGIGSNPILSISLKFYISKKFKYSYFLCYDLEGLIIFGC